MSNENTPTNTSGQGKNAVVPNAVKNRFNWGAFFLSWIWGLGNKTYVPFLIFLGGLVPIVSPIVCLGLCIWFGVKGNEWAWQNKSFPSVKAFHEYQKKWTIAGLILFTLSTICTIAGIIILINLPTSSFTDDYTKVTTTANQVNNTTLLLSIGEKCDLTSDGLAACYAKEMSKVKKASGNKITLEDNTTLSFTGNGKCKSEGQCNVTITAGTTDITIPLYTDKKGYIIIKKEDIDKYTYNASQTITNQQ